MASDIWELIFYPSRIKERRAERDRAVRKVYQEYVESVVDLSKELDENIKLAKMLNGTLRANALSIQLKIKGDDNGNDNDNDNEFTDGGISKG